MNDKVKYWLELSDYEQFTEDQKDFIDRLEPLNIEARYPSHKDY